MQVRGFHTGFGVTRRASEQLSPSPSTGREWLSQHRDEQPRGFSPRLFLSHVCLLDQSLSPKRMGRKCGEREGALQGERRGGSRHRGEVKDGARGQLLGRNQPTSDFSTFIFYQKHVIRNIKENLETPVCFFFLHVHYHFLKMFNAPFQKSTLVSVETDRKSGL